MQRSATNTACYLIDSLPDTRCDGELLNPNLWQRRTGRPLDPDPLKTMRTAFEATYSSAGNAPCTWGFNLFPQQVSQPWLLSWLWETVDRAIILERSNGETYCARTSALAHVLTQPPRMHRSDRTS